MTHISGLGEFSRYKLPYYRYYDKRRVVGPAKFFLSSSLISDLIAVQYLVAVCHTVWANVGGPNIFGSAGNRATRNPAPGIGACPTL